MFSSSLIDVCSSSFSFSFFGFLWASPDKKKANGSVRFFSYPAFRIPRFPGSYYSDVLPCAFSSRPFCISRFFSHVFSSHGFALRRRFALFYRFLFYPFLPSAFGSHRWVFCNFLCYIDLLSALLCASLLYAISLCFVFLTLYTISVFCSLRSWAFRRFLLYYASFKSAPDFSWVYIRNCFSCLFFLLFYLCLSSFFTWWYGTHCIRKCAIQSTILDKIQNIPTCLSGYFRWLPLAVCRVFQHLRQGGYSSVTGLLPPAGVSLFFAAFTVSAVGMEDAAPF